MVIIMEEMKIFVFYDIPNDKTRNKVGEKCKDYGLTRVQFSGFSGTLDRDRRKKLEIALTKIIGNKEANLIIQPICSACLKDTFTINNKKEEDDEQEQKPKIYFGMPRNRQFLDYED